MSYLQQEGWSQRKLITIGAVILLHILFGYALLSGLAIKAVKVITGPLETVNIEEAAPPPEEPPPPPPKLEEIPPYVPPPDVVVEMAAPPAPTITAQSTISTPEPPRVAPPAPPAPPPPAPPPAIPGTAPVPVARTFTVTPDDYPDASRRAGEEGVTGIRVTVGTNGRVTECVVTNPSGHARLDEKACQIAERRWRFKPATQNGEPVTATITRNYRWQLENAR